MVTAFKKCDGVADATAEYVGGFATVKYDPAKTNPEKLIAAFKTSGGPRFEAAPYKAPVYQYSGKEESLSGSLAIKGPDAGKDVVARLVAKRNGESNERVFNVIASGDVAKQVEELRQKGYPRYNITGVVSEAGITVSKIEANR